VPSFMALADRAKWTGRRIARATRAGTLFPEKEALPLTVASAAIRVSVRIQAARVAHRSIFSAGIAESVPANVGGEGSPPDFASYLALNPQLD
jgi:hypothetical protein